VTVRRLDEVPDANGNVARAAFGIDLGEARWPTHRARFERLRQRFEEETAQVSSVHEMVEASAFRDIVAMGSEAVPMLVADLERTDAPWVAWVIALRRILGDGPTISDDEAGRRDEVLARWREWLNRRS
jgi:hypothetical protein